MQGVLSDVVTLEFGRSRPDPADPDRIIVPLTWSIDQERLKGTIHAIMWMIEPWR